MDILSLEFLVFLLITVAAYYFVNLINKCFKKQIIPQWLVLLIGSIVFYGFCHWIYLVFLFSSAAVSYIASLLSNKKKGISKTAMILAIVINVGTLATLKYCNFFINSVNSVFHANWLTQNFIIPLGISFYTFSLVAYNVDCYKNGSAIEKNPLKFLLFVSYFPKILQGPISSYEQLNSDGLFKEHSFVDNNYLQSFYRIAVGLIKKIVIANIINLYVNSAYANLDNTYGLQLAVVAILYAIQLYADFSGFLDISIGVSGLFGIRLEENFDAPYLSTSIQDFWRRWHITLGAWLRKYIYIPLGGNRVGVLRWIINVLVVWLISGIWHGANWTFVLWGLYHGVLLIITGLATQIKKKNGADISKKESNIFFTMLKVCWTFLLVTLGWILFRSSSVKEAARYVWHMVKVWQASSYQLFSDSSLSEATPFLFIAFLFIAILIGAYVIKRYSDVLSLKIKRYELVSTILKYAFVIVCFSYAIFAFFYTKSIGGGESSFIYFDF